MKEEEAIGIIQPYPSIEVYIIVKLGSGVYDVEKTRIIGRWFDKTRHCYYAVTEDYVILNWNEWFNTETEARNKLKKLEEEK